MDGNYIDICKLLIIDGRAKVNLQNKVIRCLDLNSFRLRPIHTPVIGQELKQLDLYRLTTMHNTACMNASSKGITLKNSSLNFKLLGSPSGESTLAFVPIYMLAIALTSCSEIM